MVRFQSLSSMSFSPWTNLMDLTVKLELLVISDLVNQKTERCSFLLRTRWSCQVFLIKSLKQVHHWRQCTWGKKRSVCKARAKTLLRWDWGTSLTSWHKTFCVTWENHGTSDLSTRENNVQASQMRTCFWGGLLLPILAPIISISNGSNLFVPKHSPCRCTTRLDRAVLRSTTCPIYTPPPKPAHPAAVNIASAPFCWSQIWKTLPSSCLWRLK